MKKNNYFPMPNEIFCLGLDSGEIAVYVYLMSCEDRETYQCYPSYNTIGKALKMSKKTVMKYVKKDTVFIPYYIASENNGVYPEVEQRTFRSETLLSGRRPHIIYTGEGDLDKIIETVSYKKERSKKSTTVYYKDAIDKFNCPVALVPLTEDGMRQLRILSVPDYRQHLVKNILGKDYLPPTSAQSDGRNKTDNFIIGIDCNILRFENALKSKKTTNIFVLPFQAETVQEMVHGTKAKCYVINLQETEEFLGLPNTLPEINYTPFQTEKGEYIHVPPLGKGKKR